MDRTIDVPRTTPVPIPLLINRPFATLWGGQAISNLGDTVFDTTLLLWIATGVARGASWAPLAVGGVLLATALPTCLMGPLAGVFVDRWDKRRTLLWMDALRAALVLALLVLFGIVPLPVAGTVHLSHGWQLSAIYAAVAGTTTCAQFFSPARIALIGDVVPTERRAQATGLAQVTGSLSLVIGPPLAASLLFGLGVGWALSLDALSFAASFLAIASVSTPGETAGAGNGDAGTFRRELSEGWHFFVGNRVLVTVTLSAMLVTLGGGALNALNVFFLTANLHAQPNLLGWLDAGLGCGAIVGAVLASLLAERVGVARTFWASLLLMGALIVVYSRMTSFAPALAVLCLVGMPMAALNVAVTPLVLQVTPRPLIGRVIAVLSPLTSLATMVSVATAGLLSSTVLARFHAAVLGVDLGAIDTIFGAAGLLGIAAGLYAMRGLHRVPEQLPSGAQPTTPAISAIDPPV